MWTEMGGKERYERRRRWFEENRQQFLDVVGWPLIGLSSGPSPACQPDWLQWTTLAGVPASAMHSHDDGRCAQSATARSSRRALASLRSAVEKPSVSLS